MARTLPPKKSLILEALISHSGGDFVEKTAQRILYGGSRMDSLEKALKMEKHFDISLFVWIKLYKKKKSDLLKESRAEVYQLQNKREKSTIRNDLLFEALTADDGGGYSEDGAKNIVYGAKEMASLERALKMELNYDIAPSVWGKLYRE